MLACRPGGLRLPLVPVQEGMADMQAPQAIQSGRLRVRRSFVRHRGAITARSPLAVSLGGGGTPRSGGLAARLPAAHRSSGLGIRSSALLHPSGTNPSDA